MDRQPTTTAVSRATLSSEPGAGLPCFMTWGYTSCANDADAVSVRPATTARIVVKATAATIASNTVPPTENASSGTAEFSLPGADLIVSAPTTAPAP